MKQIGLFDTAESIRQDSWILFVDGASKNNPGPSGAGIYILKNNILFIKCGYYLGLKTNNQAEYLALLLGLFVVAEHMAPIDTLRIVSDSQLLVRQIQGVYKVKHPHLLDLYRACSAKINSLKATISHVLRAENSQADAMANQGVDYKEFPPKKYIEQLSRYGITL